MKYIYLRISSCDFYRTINTVGAIGLMEQYQNSRGNESIFSRILYVCVYVRGVGGEKERETEGKMEEKKEDEEHSYNIFIRERQGDR